MAPPKPKPGLVEEVKERAIMAMFSDDELMERLVLKGGNLLDIVYKVSPRASIDVDLSVDGDLGSADALRLRVEPLPKSAFREIGYEAFDATVKERPRNLSEDVAAFWGGYCVYFKIIELARFEILAVSLVPDKPTAYGRATLGAKPFRRAPK